MNRLNDANNDATPAIGTGSSRDLERFGFELPDDSWLARVRTAVHVVDGGRIGPYDIIQEISRGAQGIVYRAKQPNTNREIALKRLVAGQFATPAALARFTREIETAAALNHPNIVTVYGTEQVGDQPILAMEWVDGLPIDAWANGANQSRREVREILGVFVNVCGAVHHAHQRGVIHRDLKPTNILVDRDGAPRVLDFGLAKTLVATDDSAARGLTLTRDFVGTPLYAAPEQIRSDHDAIDIRTDVYALGVVLYQLLTGRTPHSGALHELMQSIQRDDPAPPSRVCSNISRELDAIVLKALAKEPAKRYQSVDALVADIGEFLDGRLVSAHPPSAAYRFQKLVRQNCLAFALVAAVFFVSIAFAVVSLLQAARIAEQRDLAQSRFDEVRGLAHTLVFDVHDAVAPLKGALPAREIIVETGLAYLDALAAEAGENMPLLLDCAGGYFRIARLQGDPNGANLGQTAAALESCRKGLAIVEPLLVLAPNDSAVLRHVAMGRHVLANVLTASGQTDDAIVAYDEAIAHRELATASDPTHADAPPSIERIRADLAACYERADRFVEAQEQLVTVVELLQNRLRVDPDDEERRLKLGNTLASLGHVHVQQGNADAANEPLREAIDILESGVESYPERDNIWRSLVVARTARARAAAMRGDTAFARAELEWVIDAHREMIESDPENKPAYHDLAAAHHFMGKLLDSAGDVESALSQFDQMLQIRRELAEDDPASMMAKRGVAIGLDMTGTVLRKLDRLEDALARHQEAKQTFDEIAADDPENPRHMRSVAICAYYLGQVHRDIAQRSGDAVEVQVGHWRAARDEFTHGRRVMESMRAAELLLPNESGVIEMLDNEIAACDQALATTNE